MIFSISTLSKLQSLMRTLYQSRVNLIGLAVCLLVAGCNGSKQAETMENKSGQSTLEAVATTKPETVTVDDVKHTTEAKTPVQGKPVNYDVENWKTIDASQTNRLTLNDLKKMQAIFGKVILTDKDSLDYASNTATKYRFMKGDEPYLDIIDSKEYLEFGWYFANPNDSDEEKNTSIKHAKKAYAVAQELMGEAGEELIKNMLHGQITKNKVIDGQNVALAKCEFYSCMIVLKKPS